MEYFQYFPSWVCREELPELVEKTLNDVIPFIDTYREIQTDRRVIQTENLNNTPQFSRIGRIFLEKAERVLEDQGYTTSMYNLDVSQLWGQALLMGGGQYQHTHFDAVICGLYFLKTPPKGGYPIFLDPREAKLACDLISPERKEITAATPRIHFNNVIPGTLLMFNNWLPHMVTPNAGEEETVYLHVIVQKNRK